MEALVFNIQRYCLHDGEGIRTVVFFKGCPLHCPWCSNPESQSFDIEKVKIASRCINCKSCSSDVDECPSGAIVEFGKYMSLEELEREILKDSVFYSTSGGGVTLSGGEVLSHAPFAAELLRRLKNLGIHTAIETSGQGSTPLLVEMARNLDLILFDLKIMDTKRAKEVIGADMNLIRKNLEALIEMDKNLIPRIPLIPGYTMDDENICEITDYVKSLSLGEVHLLPFHQYGSGKYEFLGKNYELKGIKTPSEEEINKIKNYMEAEGLKVVIGGL